MTDDNVKKDTLKISSPSRLQLTKTVDAGKVKQKFTHGREKAVTVEVRKTRTFAQGTGGAMVEVKKPLGGPSRAEEPEAFKNLNEEERQARMKALKFVEERGRQEIPAAPTPQEEEPEDTAEAATPRARKDGVVLSPLLSGKRPAAAPAGAKPAARPADPAQPVEPAPQNYDRERPEKADVKGDTKGSKLKLGKRGDERRNSGKITVTQALAAAEEQRVRSLASMRRQREKALKKAQGTLSKDQEKIVREVVIPEAIEVQELANRMAVRAVDVIKVLMKLGVMATVTQSIDADTAELVVSEFGHNFKRVAESDVENVLEKDVDSPESLKPRPPVVTVMGHVDHGKTSLLDSLRQTDVAAKEAGGITQHIGAYQVDLGKGRVTFIDTPGHEAFTSMRARGAKVTDIVVLVVAADDGIMAQTKEAIAHAKAAGVPIIVAVNKIDKPGADPERVKNELMQYELVPEEYGGDVIVVPVSAKMKTGLDKLIDSILVQSEVLEIKANPDRPGQGAVIESQLDQGRGVVATLLVQRGTLRVGDIVVAGSAYGRVRAVIDDKGQNIKEATPGMPVEILGLSTPPEAGDVFSVVEDEKTARDIADYRARNARSAQQALASRTMEQLFGAASAGTKELAVIIRGDVQGSVEAISASISKFSGEEVSVKILHAAVGAISESDITLAKATNALIIAFNVRASPKAKDLASRDKVNIRYYSVIYDVVDDIKSAISGMLSPTIKENFIGYAEIRQIFNITKSGKVAGCYITEGVVKRGAGVRLLRDGVVIHQGTLKTLKRFKDEVKEVKSGFECGMAFENYDDIREGDMIEAFETVEEARTV